MYFTASGQPGLLKFVPDKFFRGEAPFNMPNLYLGVFELITKLIDKIKQC
jgi:hypothetical protein